MTTQYDPLSGAPLGISPLASVWFANNAAVPPNKEMRRLRDMLDEAHIEWYDASGMGFCRTNDTGDYDWTFSAICGEHTCGEIELWTKTMIENKQNPTGLQTAEEAFALIREEMGA